MSVIFTDNSRQVLAELERKKTAALEACGNTAVSAAKQNIEEAGRISTGTMIGDVNHQVDGDACHVGTNVRYAIYNEMGTGIYIGGGRNTPWSYQDENGDWHRTSGMPPIHFLKNAIANNIDVFKKIIKDILER